MRNLINTSALRKLEIELTKTVLAPYLDRCIVRSQERCPVDTGALRNSIHSKIISPGMGLVIAGGNSVTDNGESRLVDYAEENEFTHPTRRGFLRTSPPEI